MNVIIKRNELSSEERELKYPLWAKHKEHGHLVFFLDSNLGVYITLPPTDEGRTSSQRISSSIVPVTMKNHWEILCDDDVIEIIPNNPYI